MRYAPPVNSPLKVPGGIDDILQHSDAVFFPMSFPEKTAKAAKKTEGLEYRAQSKQVIDMVTDRHDLGDAGSPDEKKNLELVAKIQGEIIQKFGLGFDVEVLNVLDDIDSSEMEIEALTGRMDSGIVARLSRMAEAVHFGQSRVGGVRNFYQVVSRLGMEYTKSMIVFFALLNLSKSKRIEKMLAAGFAASVIGGKIISKDLDLRREAAAGVEIGALLKDIGRIMITLYEDKCGQREDFIAPTEEFISSHQSRIGIMFVDHYGLPAVLKEIIAEDTFSCDVDTISIAGIVNMAHAVVEASFRRHGKLVMKSPMPDPGGIITQSFGSVAEDYFRAAGLLGYLQVLRVPGSRRPVAEFIKKS